MTMFRPRPKLTRADIGPNRRTDNQKRLAARTVIILASYAQGCSVKLIAQGLAIGPARVRDVLARFNYPVPPG